MVRRPPVVSVSLSILFCLGFPSLADLQAQPALEALLERIPAAEAGDANRYSLTDVQYALGLDLDWNPLLRRAQLRDADNAPILTLLADSEVGRVGVDWVQWSRAPRMNNGQLFVSQEVLSSLLSRFPNLGPEAGEETVPPDDSIEQFPGEAPPYDSASPSFPGGSPVEIRNLLALFYPVSEYLLSASDEARGVTEVLSEALSQSLSEKGIGLTSLPWDAEESRISAVNADAVLAFWIQSGSPISPASFFIYDSPWIGGGPSALTEWGRVDRAQQAASRRLAQKLRDRYLEIFGESRTLGLRSGPIGSLQGRSALSVMVFVGVDSASAEGEIRKVARMVAEALSPEKEEG